MKKISYKCQLCSDTGWIMVPNKDGIMVARSCECRKNRLSEKQWLRFGIDMNEPNFTFKNFLEHNDAAKNAKEIARKYFRAFEDIKNSRNNSIAFCGQPGSGKTHLSLALAANFFKKKHEVVYMPYRESITSLKQSIMDSRDYAKKMSRFKKAEILVIDDLFKGKASETDVNIVFEVINYRYINVLPTIISSEHTLGDFIKIDEAVGSRIYEMCNGYFVTFERDSKNNYRLKGIKNKG